MAYPDIAVDGAIVMVTGGARGIGKATCELFAARGATVCAGDLDLTMASRQAATVVLAVGIGLGLMRSIDPSVPVNGLVDTLRLLAGQSL